MPILNGTCIPTICMTIYFDTTNISVERTDGTTVAPQPAALYKKELDAFRDATRRPVEIGCDTSCGCRCYKPRVNPCPWIPLAPQPISVDTIQVPGEPDKTITTQIVGAQQKIWQGYCVAPGNKIRFAGEDWQEAPKFSAPKKAGKKKTVKKKPAAKKRAVLKTKKRR